MTRKSIHQRLVSSAPQRKLGPRPIVRPAASGPLRGPPRPVGKGPLMMTIALQRGPNVQPAAGSPGWFCGPAAPPRRLPTRGRPWFRRNPRRRAPKHPLARITNLRTKVSSSNRFSGINCLHYGTRHLRGGRPPAIPGGSRRAASARPQPRQCVRFAFWVATKPGGLRGAHYPASYLRHLCCFADSRIPPSIWRSPSCDGCRRSTSAASFRQMDWRPACLATGYGGPARGERGTRPQIAPPHTPGRRTPSRGADAAGRGARSVEFPFLARAAREKPLPHAGGEPTDRAPRPALRTTGCYAFPHRCMGAGRRTLGESFPGWISIHCLLESLPARPPASRSAWHSRRPTVNRTRPAPAAQDRRRAAGRTMLRGLLPPGNYRRAAADRAVHRAPRIRQCPAESVVVPALRFMRASAARPSLAAAHINIRIGHTVFGGRPGSPDL